MNNGKQTVSTMSNGKYIVYKGYAFSIRKKAKGGYIAVTIDGIVKTTTESHSAEVSVKMMMSHIDKK